MGEGTAAERSGAGVGGTKTLALIGMDQKGEPNGCALDILSLSVLGSPDPPAFSSLIAERYPEPTEGWLLRIR